MQLPRSYFLVITKSMTLKGINFVLRIFNENLFHWKVALLQLISSSKDM